MSDPEAMRYGFDGFGYKYIDSGSGSDWRTRHPDAEPLYLSQPTQSDDEAYELGKRDGYESAVQDIDMLTGGDGEYCYSTIGGELHCPNVDTMKARIARRLRQPTQSDALREALEDLLHAVCGEKGFAEAVRRDSGRVYPWPALDLAEAKAIAALEQSK